MTGTGHLVDSLDALMGHTPSLYEHLYRMGRPLSLASLGREPQTRLLAVVPRPAVDHLTRPLVHLYSKLRGLAVDKRFQPDQRRGTDAVLGKVLYRFKVEHANSQLDQAPTLILSYADPADANAWPVPAMFDELRCVGPGVALGPTLVRGWQQPLFWFGMEAGKSERSPTNQPADSRPR